MFALFSGMLLVLNKSWLNDQMRDGTARRDGSQQRWLCSGHPFHLFVASFHIAFFTSPVVLLISSCKMANYFHIPSNR